MDYIHSLLIAEDDLHDVESGEAAADVMNDQTPISVASPEPGPSIPQCKCEVCQIVPQKIENKCCGQRNCVTTVHYYISDCENSKYYNLCTLFIEKFQTQNFKTFEMMSFLGLQLSFIFLKSIKLSMNSFTVQANSQESEPLLNVFKYKIHFCQ